MYVISILLTKIVYRIINILNLGAGYTWPGHLVLKIYPGIISEIKNKLPDKVVFVSGTNGKTTTVKLIKHILEKKDMKVMTNSSGANLLNGIVSSVLLASDLGGNFSYEAAVFEVDESTLPPLLKDIRPSILALLNLSRDQLDRHWETDIVLDKWEEAVANLGEDTVLVLDETQDKFEVISRSYKGTISYFNDDRKFLYSTDLKGSFNAKNVNCAILTAEKLGVRKDEAARSLKDFEFAYGRGEMVREFDKNWQILLAKNPESMNQNLNMLLEEGIDQELVLFVLSDNIPDGLDVSWIYDVRPELITKVCKNKEVFVSGKRALDMAVRLRYTGVDVSGQNISENLKNTIEKISDMDSIKNVTVLPNYSSMLEVRNILVGRKIL